MREPAFSLLDIMALAPGLVEASDWANWAARGVWPPENSLPATPLIPPMQARRMSQAARLAVQLALTLITRWRPGYLICVSRHGELQRTQGLLQQLVCAQPLSPTDFSLSVHNTVAGLATIAAGVTIPATSIAAGEGGLHAGFIEACARLAVHDTPVLLLCFDGPVPDFYQPWVPAQLPVHAVAMVLTRGQQWRYQGSEAADPVAPALSQPLQFWRSWLRGEPECRLDGGAQQRVWRC